MPTKGAERRSSRRRRSLAGGQTMLRGRNQRIRAHAQGRGDARLCRREDDEDGGSAVNTLGKKHDRAGVIVMSGDSRRVICRGSGIGADGGRRFAGRLVEPGMGRGRKGEEIKGQYEKRKKARTSALRGAYRERADGAVLTHEGWTSTLSDASRGPSDYIQATGIITLTGVSSKRGQGTTW
jgi:hypothetical protein